MLATKPLERKFLQFSQCLKCHGINIRNMLVGFPNQQEKGMKCNRKNRIFREEAAQMAIKYIVRSILKFHTLTKTKTTSLVFTAIKTFLCS